MRRREFIGLVCGGAVAPLLTPALRAIAQQNAKIPRVGILSPASSETAATLAAFRKGIRDLGYVEGQTIVLDFRLSKRRLRCIPQACLATDQCSGRCDRH
jgi:putative tryptophan/tyrosine transport system substrate-binding protein